MFTYSTSALRSLLESVTCRSKSVVSSGVWSTIKGLGINKRQRWKRGGTSCKWKEAQNPQPKVHSPAQECSTTGPTKVNNAVEPPTIGYKIQTHVTNRQINTVSKSRNYGVQPHNLIQVPISNTRQDLRFIYINARSVCNKSDVIANNIIDNDADICTITETWLHPGDRDRPDIKDLTPDGYKLHHVPRQGGKGGGGVAVVYKANMNMTTQLTESYTSFEHMEMLMRTSNDCIRLCVMYRPPSNSVADFMEDFLDFIDHHTTTSGRLLVVGDLNLHLDNEKDRNASVFRDLMHSLNLYQHVHEPTHDRGHILDVVVTSTDDSSLIEGLSVLPFDRSDHHILSFTLPWSRPTSVKTKHNFRKIKDINIEAFKESVRTSNLVQSPPTELNDLVQEYDRTLADILEQHAPLLTKEVVLRPHAPWYNSSIREAKLARRKAERRYRKDKTTINKDMFKDSQREVNRLCTEAETEHLSRKVSKNEKDPKALFNIAKQMLAKGKDNTLPSHGSEKDLANKSATFFDTKIATIRKHSLAP